MFVNGNLSQLTLNFEQQHIHNLSVGRISMHKLGTYVTFADPCFITMISDRRKHNIPVSVNIS